MNQIKYHEDKNPRGDYLPGVPLDDMTVAEFAALPDWLQVSVAMCPFYTVPASVKPDMPEPEPEPEPTPIVASAVASATATETKSGKRRANTVRSANG